MFQNGLMERNRAHINATFNVVQMIPKDVFKDWDRCLLTEADDSEVC